MSARHFTDDVKWTRSDAGRATFSLCAYTPDEIWLMCVEHAPKKGRIVMARLEHDHDTGWLIATTDAGAEVYDASQGRSFVRLKQVPPILAAGHDEAMSRIESNADLLLEKGISRQRARVVESIQACRGRIEHARDWIARRTEKLEAEVAAIDSSTRLIHIGPSPDRQTVREVVNCDLGPLILEILDGDKFSLSIPQSSPDKDLMPLSAVWTKGAWKNLPADPRNAEIVERLGEGILHDRYRDFRRVAWSRLAVARHDLMMEEDALEILQSTTLPKLEAELNALEADRATAASSPSLG